MIALLAAGCASAGGQSGGDDEPPADARPDGTTLVDAPGADAPPLDGPGPTAVTLSQTTSSTIGPESSLACGNSDGTTAENSWYRVFRLADANITGALQVSSVTFGVQESAGMPPVQIKIGTYSGNVQPPPAQLDPTLITPITATTFAVPDTQSTATRTVTVPIVATVPALSQMIVEIYAPSYQGQAKYFYLGGNNGGESRPSYLRAPSTGCGATQPRTTASLGFPTSHLVISVSGTY